MSVDSTMRIEKALSRSSSFNLSEKAELRTFRPSAVVLVLWSFTFSKMDPFPSSFMISLMWSMVRNEVWHTDMAASFSSSLFTSSGTDFTGLKGS